jgi:N-acylneuraminate cytidylyltransferase
VPLAGRPLLAYSIEHALMSRCITRTIVSTDDEEIAEVARRWGAEVPFRRPSELAADASADIDVFRHALAWLRDAEGYSCECVVHLRPTGPVRRVETVDRAIETFQRHSAADSLRSVSMASQSPYKMWRLEGEYLHPLLPLDSVIDSHSRPRQTLPDAYWQNGYVDIVRPHVVLDLGRMAGDTVLAFLIDEPVLEIDYEDNLPAVERALLELREGRWPDPLPVGKRHAV